MAEGFSWDRQNEYFNYSEAVPGPLSEGVIHYMDQSGYSTGDYYYYYEFCDSNKFAELNGYVQNNPFLSYMDALYVLSGLDKWIEVEQWMGIM